MGFDAAWDKLERGDFSQPGPMAGHGRGPGRPWRGLCEETPQLWVGWVVNLARMTANAVPVALLVAGVRIPIPGVRLTFGVRYYFRCPRCHRRCEAVYILGRVPACRKCHHLGYQSQARRNSSIYGVLDALAGRDAWDKPKRYDVDSVLLADVLDGARHDLATRLAAALDGITVAVEATTGD